MRVTPALPRRSTRNEVRRRRFLGLFGLQSPQPSAGRGTPPDEPQPRMVNFRDMRTDGSQDGTEALTGAADSSASIGRGVLLKSRKKLSVVWRARSSVET